MNLSFYKRNNAVSLLKRHTLCDLDEIWGMACDIFDYRRCITGEGLRETIGYIQDRIPTTRHHRVKSGYKAFDWNVPLEWNLKEAYILDSSGKRIIDYNDNPLCVIQYSESVSMWVDKKVLDNHIVTYKDLPQSTQYATSYYERRWGFSIPYDLYRNMSDDRYYVHIEADHFRGWLDYADIIFKGKTKQEALFSTYICHPSMGNNETSGPVVQTFLAKWIESLDELCLTYRFIFCPETIGTLVYLSKNLKILKRRTIAGYVITCVGDSGSFSYIASQNGDNYADRIAKQAFKELGVDYTEYDWMDRGSDERQYLSPGIDLPVCSITKTKYGKYKEYHTSDDNLDFISSEGLCEALTYYKIIILLLEFNKFPRLMTFGEPFLTRYGLYETLSVREICDASKLVLDLCSFSNGERDFIEIAQRLDCSFFKLVEVASVLEEKNILKLYSHSLSS